MAISRIQQSQISGSLSYDDTLTADSGLLSKSKLSDDLNALRSLIKDIKGAGSWYSAATQDLQQVYSAMHADGVNADFQGEVSSVGLASIGAELFVAGASGLSGSLDVAGIASFAQAANVGGNLHVGGGYGTSGVSAYADGNLSMDGNLVVAGNVELGSSSADAILFNGKASSILDMDSHKIAALAQATAAGDALAWGQNASVSDLIVSAGDFKVDADGNVSAGGQLWVAGAVGLSGSVAFAGAADFNAGITADSISIDGDSVGRLYVVGADGSISDSASMWYDASGSKLFLSGAVEASGAMSAASIAVAGAASAASATVSGLVSAGSATISGGAAVGGTLTVTGATALNGGLTMDTNKFVVSDTSGNVSTAGTLGVAMAANFGSTVAITGAATLSSTLAVTSGAQLQSTLAVGGAATFASTVAISGAATLNSLSVTGAGGLAVTNASAFNGLADFNAGITANAISIDGDTAQRLYIVGADGAIKDESELTYDGTQLKIGGPGGNRNLLVTGDATVDGNLLVKGAFTYIETENMKVKDAFIYLATGSAGTSDSGIVLSKGAGGSWDLVVGQDGGGGELIFAKQAHNSSGDAPADIGGSALVPAWLSSAKIGANQGSMVGSVSKDGSDLSVKAEAGAELKLTALGDEVFSLAANGEQATFDSNFTATTLVGAINELKAGLVSANSGGNLSKASYGSADFAANVLSFAGQGTLASANHKLVDVYLNGVLMAPSRDLTAISTTSVTFDASIVSALVAEDVIVVIQRG